MANKAAGRVRIANGAGFWGDRLDAPRRLLDAAEVDYLTLEYLAELTLSILARQREKDPQAGFATDFLTVLDSVTPHLAARRDWKIVTNAGGMNPTACAVAAARRLVAAGLPDTPLAAVTGDDLLPRLAQLQAAGCRFAHFDTGRPLAQLAAEVVSANAYLGARPLVDALAQGARIVITGRVADASLTVAPAVHEFGWAWNDWPRLAAASVAGHIIECGAQATGGFYTFYDELDLTQIGYPIAELTADGEITITKPQGSGGAVNCETVVEQLVYEIDDPAHYLTPDVDVDFRQLNVEETGPDRVAVRGAQGAAPPGTYKVSLAYRAGYSAAGELLVYGGNPADKARTCAKLVFDRLQAEGCMFAETNVECLGAGAGVPGLADAPQGLREVVLRLSVFDPRRDVVERFARELVPLATSGPAGLAGYTQARATVRPVFAYWPTRIERSLITPTVEVRRAAEWLT